MSAIFSAFLLELGGLEQGQATRITSEIIASGSGARLLSGVTWVDASQHCTRSELASLLRNAGVEVADPVCDEAVGEAPPLYASDAQRRWCNLLRGLAFYAKDMQDLVPGLRYVKIDVVGSLVNIEVAALSEVFTYSIDLDQAESASTVPIDIAIAFLRAHEAPEVAEVVES